MKNLKKVMCAMLTLTIISTVLVLPVAISSAAAPDPLTSDEYTKIFKQDFEDIDGDKIGAGGIIAPSDYADALGMTVTNAPAVDLKVADGNGGKVISWTKSAGDLGTGDIILYKSLSPTITTGEAVVSLKFKMPLGGQDTYIEIGNSTLGNTYPQLGIKDLTATQLRLTITGKDIDSGDGTAGERNYIVQGNYSSNDFVRFDFVYYDIAERKFDLYVNGEKVNDAPIRYSIKDSNLRLIERVQIRQKYGTSAAGTYALDDIYAGRYKEHLRNDPKASGLYSEIFSQDFEAIAPNTTFSTDENISSTVERNNLNMILYDRNTVVDPITFSVVSSDGSKVLSWNKPAPRDTSKAATPYLHKDFDTLSSGEVVASMKFKLPVGTSDYPSLRVGYYAGTEDNYAMIDFANVSADKADIKITPRLEEAVTILAVPLDMVNYYCRVDVVFPEVSKKEFDVYINGKKINTTSYKHSTNDAADRERPISGIRIRQNYQYAYAGTFCIDDIYVGRYKEHLRNDPKASGLYEEVFSQDFERITENTTFLTNEDISSTVERTDLNMILYDRDTVNINVPFKVVKDGEEQALSWSKATSGDAGSEVSPYLQKNFAVISKGMFVASTKFKIPLGNSNHPSLCVGDYARSSDAQYARIDLINVTASKVDVRVIPKDYGDTTTPYITKNVPIDTVNYYCRVDVVFPELPSNKFDVYINGKKLDVYKSDIKQSENTRFEPLNPDSIGSISGIRIRQNYQHAPAGTFYVDDIYVGAYKPSYRVNAINYSAGNTPAAGVTINSVDVEINETGTTSDVIVALYSDNALVDVVVANGVTASGSIPVNINIPPEQANYYVKVMMWDSINGLSPRISAYDSPEKQQ